MPNSNQGMKAKDAYAAKVTLIMLEIMSRRKALRIIWELSKGAHTFRELQESCGSISPTVQNRRLKELRSAGLVEHSWQNGYTLTTYGRDLLTSAAPLRKWVERWSASPHSKKLVSDTGHKPSGKKPAKSQAKVSAKTASKKKR